MKLFISAAALAAVGSGFYLRGSFLHKMLVFVPLVYLWIPLTLIILGLGLVKLASKRSIPRDLRTAFIVVSTVAGAMMASFWIGVSLPDSRAEDAQAYVAQVVPLLDAYKKQHGRYPKTLDKIQGPPLPKILTRSNSYSADRNHFWFRYRDTHSMLGDYYFYSGSRKWTAD